MDNFLERIAEQRKAKFPRIAMPGGLIMGDMIGAIIERGGANIYQMPTSLGVTKTDFIEFRDPGEITDGVFTKQKLQEIKTEDELVKASLEILKNSHGLFIPGGAHLRDGKPNLRRTIEEECYKAAKDRQMPIFGVCAGAQLIVLYEGGEIKDIDKKLHKNADYENFIPELKGVERPEDRGEIRKRFLMRFSKENVPLGLPDGKYYDPWYEFIVADRTDKAGKFLEGQHGVEIVAGSTLARLVGSEPLKHVFSSHFMQINEEKLPSTIAVSARADSDGSIEAVELKDYPFCLGVSFHPEMSANLYNPIVKEFIKSAAQFRDAGRLR